VAPLQTSDLLPLRLRPRSTSQPLPPGCMNSMQLQATGASKSRTPGPHSGVDCGGGWTRQAPHTSPKRMAFSHFLVGYTHSGILMCIAMCIAPAVCWSRLNGFVVELSCSILAPPIDQPCPFCLFIFLFSAQLQLQSPSFEKQGKGDGDGQSTLYVATGVTLRHLQGVTRAGQHGSGCTPPPPCPRTTLRKNQPLVPRSNSRITFFTRVVGFSCFWWM
jgi:hypothetical protein